MIEQILKFYHTYTYLSMSLAAIASLGLLIVIFSWAGEIIQFIRDALIIVIPLAILYGIYWLWMNYL